MAKPASATKKPDARNSELAQIHIAKKDLGLDDETYRAMLFTIARVRSSGELDHAGRAKVLDHLKKCGWKPKTSQMKSRPSDDPQINMCRALWLQLHTEGKVYNPKEEALQRYAQRQTKVARLEWLNSKQMNTVIESLKKWLDRAV